MLDPNILEWVLALELGPCAHHTLAHVRGRGQCGQWGAAGSAGRGQCGAAGSVGSAGNKRAKQSLDFVLHASRA